VVNSQHRFVASLRPIRWSPKLKSGGSLKVKWNKMGGLRTVTVLGGYGIFGRRISEALAQRPHAQVRVAGRNRELGDNFARRINAGFIPCNLSDTTHFAEL